MRSIYKLQLMIHFLKSDFLVFLKIIESTLNKKEKPCLLG